MKKHIFFIALSTFLQIGLQGQMHDANWLLGFSSSTQDTMYGGMTLTFYSDSMAIKKWERALNFQETVSSMSDEDGNLLFYSNGVAAANKDNEMLANGQGLTPGVFAKSSSI